MSLLKSVPMLPRRDRTAHKGDFGRILLVAGSRGMSGAACLAGLAALRAGAGLVTVACPAVVQELVASFEPCYMTLPLPCDEVGRIDPTAASIIMAQPCDVIAVGPGIGRSEGLGSFVKKLLVQSAVPIILDADALNALVGRSDVLRPRRHPTILTPHVGEFSRLSGKTPQDIQSRRESVASQYAASTGVIVVLKGSETVVAAGSEVFVNPTGNPGMATAGAGDVLTGVIAALIGQGLSPPDAARLGVYVHGLAGDLASAEIGEISLIARDIIDFLPAAFKRLQRSAVDPDEAPAPMTVAARPADASTDQSAVAAPSG